LELTSLGRRVSYLEQGTGTSLVLLHAGGSSGRQWIKTASLLESDFRVVAPDLWGFGLTETWTGDESLTHDLQARLVADVIEQLALGPSHVVGHSYGGATAVRLALESKALVKSLILIEPILMLLLRLAGEEQAFKEWADIAQAFLGDVVAGKPELGWQRFINYRNGPGTWEALSADAKARFVAGTANTVAGFHSNLNNPTTLEDLRRIQVPALVLCGEKTTLPDRRVTEILRDQIPGCQYALIPGAEHMSPLSHPGFIADAIRKMAQSVGVTRAASAI
jgi:pimeloyl-ACP methyl ester carboxylesterase